MALYYEEIQSPISSVIDEIKVENAIFDEIIISDDMDFDYKLKEFNVKYPDAVELLYPYTPTLTYSQMTDKANIIKRIGISSSNAFASSTHIPNAYMPYEAFDGNIASVWASQSPPNVSGEYFGMFLDSPRNIDEFAIAWDGDFYANTVEFQISDDGVNWTSVQTFNKASAGVSVGTRYTLSRSVLAQYFRVYFTNANVAEVGYRIKEFSLYDNYILNNVTKYKCGDFVNITYYSNYAKNYKTKYILFDSSNQIIAYEDITRGKIDTSDAAYIGFTISSDYSGKAVPITFETEAVDLLYFPDEWTYDIKLHAKFNNSVVAGGIQYDLRNLNDSCGFIIKKRAVTDILWSFAGYFKSSDFILDDSIIKGSFTDKTCIPNEDYQYMVIPVLYGNELSPIVLKDSIRCYTDGISISDKDNTYYTILEPKLSGITQNKGSVIIETLNGKYPYTFKSGSRNYITGSASGLFAPNVEEKDYIFDNANNNNITWKYRKNFREWLCNGNAKILKYYDGRTFLVGISDTVTDDDSEHIDKNITTFNFTEIGDITSPSDLIEAGIIESY